MKDDAPGPAAARGAARLHALGLIPLAIWFLWQASYYWIAVIDDAYIGFRFADMFVNGFGFVFNEGGPRVEGFTNFLWIVALAPCIAAGWDAMLAAKLLGLACALATLVVTWRLSASLRQREDWLNLLPAAFLAVNSGFSHWALMGLETPLAVLLVAAVYWRTVEEFDDPRRLPVSPFLAVLASMTRIDTLYFMAPLAVYMAFRLAGDRRLARTAVWWALCAAIPFFCYQFWRVSYFGDWFPNTYYAKQRLVELRPTREMGLSHLRHFFLRQTAPESADPGFMGTLGHVARGGPVSSFWWINWWLGGLLVSLAFPTARRLLVQAPIALLAYYLWHVDGDWMPNFRFQQVALPFLAVAGVCAWDAVTERLAGVRWRGILWAAPVVMLLGVAQEQTRLGYVYIFGKDPILMPRDPGWWRPSFVAARLAEGFYGPLNEVSEHLLLNTRDGATIFMSDIGQPLWFARHLSLLDGCGLCDPYLGHAPSVRGELKTPDDYFAEYMAQRGASAPPLSDEELRYARQAAHRASFEDHLRRNVRYVLGDKRPEYLLIFLLHPDNDPEKQGYPYPEIAASIWSDPVRLGEYEFVWRTPKIPQVWNTLYRRKGVPADVPEAIRAARIVDAISRNPRMFSLLSLGVRELQTYHDPKAIQPLREAIGARVPRVLKSRRGTLDLAAASLAAGDHTFAAELLARATARRPSDLELWKLRAEAEWALGARDEAVAALRSAIAAAKPYLSPDLHVSLITRLEGMGRYDEALAEARSLVNLSPADPGSWRVLAVTAHRVASTGGATREERAARLAIAIEAYRKLAELEPAPDIEAKLRELARQAEWLERLAAEEAAP